MFKELTKEEFEGIVAESVLRKAGPHLSLAFAYYAFFAENGRPILVGYFARRQRRTYIHVSLLERSNLKGLVKDTIKWLGRTKKPVFAEVLAYDSAALRFAEFFGFKTEMYLDGYAIMVYRNGNVRDTSVSGA